MHAAHAIASPLPVLRRIILSGMPLFVMAGVLVTPAHAAPLSVTTDTRAVATQLTGADGDSGFDRALAATATPLQPFSAVLTDTASAGATHADAEAAQASSLATQPDRLTLAATGHAQAAASTGAGGLALAAAVSNLAFAFDVTGTPARFSAAGRLDGSSTPVTGPPGTFGLVAMSLAGNGAAVLTLVSSNVDDRLFAVTEILSPGHYVLTVVANVAATIPSGTGPAARFGHASYRFAATVTAVPLPGAFWPFALAAAAALRLVSCPK